MPSVRKSVIVPHAAEVMFDLVDDFERYPEFLPWCSSAKVLERDGKLTRGRLGIDFRGFRSEITTVNVRKPGRSISLELVDGPFEKFEGLWTFTPLGKDGSRVELAVDYTFASGTLQALMAPVFGHITGTLVERFVQRAGEVAG
jgi:ribosome-associated toxin RatA of RatAB toxin-antitoxin module